MSTHRFLRCSHCGNLVGVIEAKGGVIVCCGDPMQEIVPNTTEAAQEKHLPVITRDGDIVTVRVGSVDHPMTEEHLIQWIYLETKQGGQRKGLVAGAAPAVDFCVKGDEPVAAYAYCNLHGLWKTQI